MKDHEDVQRLIRLKQYETPGEEYFEEFAESFKERQRAEMLKHSSTELFAERLQLWFSEMNGAKWAVPAGAAVAALAAGIYIAGPSSENADASFADNVPQGFAQPGAADGETEIIQLRIPKSSQPRIPGMDKTGDGGVLPASHAPFREL